MSVRVDCKVLSGPNLDVAIEGVNDRLRKAGWPPSSFGAGSPSFFPYPVEAHWIFNVPDTASNRALAVGVTKAACGVGVVSAYWDFVASGVGVAADIAEDGAAVVAAAGQATADAAHGIGQGIGFGIVVVAAVAAVLYFGKGRA